MNWFQRLWATPKFHAVLTVLGTIAAAIAPPPWNMVAMTIGGLSGANAAILPHQDVTPVGTALPPGAVVVTAPVPATGTMHAQDYVNALAPALGLPAVALPATGAMHQADYARLILALTTAMQAAPADAAAVANAASAAATSIQPLSARA